MRIFIMKMRRALFSPRVMALAITGLLSACGTPEYDHRPVLYEASFDDLAGWRVDNLAVPYRMFAQSCKQLAKRRHAFVTKSGALVGDRAAWMRVCQLAKSQPELGIEAARTFFEREFTPFHVTTRYSETGRFTGYYEPLLFGSQSKTAQFNIPVYGLPVGAENAHFSRAQIDAGALKNRAPALVYVDDETMLFFLHIQGSGKVQLPDGRLMSLQYAGANGHDYVPIGRVLKQSGALEKLSLQTIRDWLYNHPNQAQSVMQQNPAYVFFKLAAGDAHPKGALGIALTPMRSLAIDDDQTLYAQPVYIETDIPGSDPQSPLPFARLMIAQDTGGAILGAHRGDIFFGRGAQAEYRAGHQNSKGLVYWLLPKP
jgi:membrane-bound lytic murein transglycosylase A